MTIATNLIISLLRLNYRATMVLQMSRLGICSPTSRRNECIIEFKSIVPFSDIKRITRSRTRRKCSDLSVVHKILTLISPQLIEFFLGAFDFPPCPKYVLESGERPRHKLP
mmetsp:Transcript_33227/g.46371  ORF Transcript_33227/g.46371 Transcript_33227/m.46371 type:complete len:111 (+) Transcript_33227:28-360(+)